MRFKAACILIIALLAVTIGCTKEGNVTVPDPVTTEPQSVGHQIWGAYDIIWDGISDTLEFVPNRSSVFHIDVTPFFMPEHVSMTIINYDPVAKVFTLDVTIDNPFPVNGFDVRGIVDNLGTGALLNPDDYTKLFDTDIPPVANPFRAFAKDEDHRTLYSRFSMPEKHIKSEIYELYLPGPITATLLLEASWPENCAEPYDIVSIDVVGEIVELTGSLDVTVEVLDWQNVTAADVVIEANSVTVTDVHLTQISDTKWTATILNVGGVGPGNYEAWVAAWDATANDALYNKFIITVGGTSTWNEPILVSGEPGVDEILPRIVQRPGEVWIIYTNGNEELSRTSFDGGMTWSPPSSIGGYAGIDTLHAVEGQDHGIYVQYQRSGVKTTYVTAYQGGMWQTPIVNNLMGLTTSPYSCDLGISHNGFLFDMWTGDWSMFGFHSDYVYDLSSWTFDNIETFYNCVYSINDGFVQQAGTPKLFYIHDETTLDFGSWDGSVWNRGAAFNSTDRLIEPAVAPESDDPYHIVVATDRGSYYELQYVQFTSWPPAFFTSSTLESSLAIEPVFHSISAEGPHLSILYDADGEVRYVESNDGGINFSPYETLGSGGNTYMYSHIRQDPYTNAIVAAYAKEESGDYNIYVQFK